MHGKRVLIFSMEFLAIRERVLIFKKKERKHSKSQRYKIIVQIMASHLIQCLTWIRSPMPLSTCDYVPGYHPSIKQTFP